MAKQYLCSLFFHITHNALTFAFEQSSNKQKKKQTLFTLIMLLICSKAPLRTHAAVSSGARGINFGLDLQLHPYFVYANNDCADSLEPSLLANTISNTISGARSFHSRSLTRIFDGCEWSTVFFFRRKANTLRSDWFQSSLYADVNYVFMFLFRWHGSCINPSGKSGLTRSTPFSKEVVSRNHIFTKFTTPAQFQLRLTRLVYLVLTIVMRNIYVSNKFSPQTCPPCFHNSLN